MNHFAWTTLAGIVVVLCCIHVKGSNSGGGTVHALKCAGTEWCNCTAKVEQSDEVYVYECRNPRESHKPPLVVEMLPEKKLEIECTMQIDIDERYVAAASSAAATGVRTNAARIQNSWLPMLVGINCSRTFAEMTIQNCPLPAVSAPSESASFKGDILEQLRIEAVEILRLRYIANGDRVLGSNFYWRGMETLRRLHLQHNELVELSPHALRNLSSLQHLYVNDNALRTLDARLFEPVAASLQVLELGHNNLTALDDNHELLRHMPNLEQLNLYGNGLRAAPLRRRFFGGAAKLRILDLSGNRIESLDEDAFADLRLLQRLTLSFNRIDRLPPALLAECHSLQQLRASYAMGGATTAIVTTLPSTLFANHSELVTVSLDGNNLSALPDDLFRGTPNLTEILLNKNRLVDLPATLFRHTVKLQTLDLSGNRLASLDDAIFATLKYLTVLNLRDNRIRTISSRLFASLGRLRTLSLRNNGLVTVQPSGFAALRALESVDLSHNQLDMVDATDPSNQRSLLSNCVNVREIRLHNNSVVNIFEDWLFVHLHLQMLDLSYNRIENITIPALLQNKPELTIDLSHNRIGVVNLSYLEEVVAAQCYGVTICNSVGPIIILRGNPIICDCRAFDLARYYQDKLKVPSSRILQLQPKNLNCIHPQSKRNVSLSSVRLNELRCPWQQLVNPKAANETNSCPPFCDCLFSPLDQSLLVDCSASNSNANDNNSNGNRSSVAAAETVPRRIPWESFVRDVDLRLSNKSLASVREISKLLESFNVTKLSLSSNKLENVDSLHIPPQLKVLELHDNRLIALDKKIIDKLDRLTNLTRVTLHDNPWSCNCDTQHLVNFLRAKYLQVHVPNLASVRCAESGKAISELSVEELCPLSVTVITICVSLAAFGVLFGATILLYYRFEHELKVWMFANKVCLWLVTEKEVDRDKQFDAFVSYSHLDEPFVVEQLLPTLEGGERPLRLCVHFRDWLVGEWIPEQIVRSVESSRRTIVVLSPNFLSSVWAQIEFRTAHLKAIKERCARVIVVLLEDIGPADKLDPELKAYLTMNTYVKWGDPWFWQKLRYALPHPQLSSSRRNRHRRNRKGRPPSSVLNNEKAALDKDSTDKRRTCISAVLR